MWLGRVRISSMSSHFQNVHGNDVPANSGNWRKKPAVEIRGKMRGEHKDLARFADGAKFHNSCQFRHGLWRPYHFPVSHFMAKAWKLQKNNENSVNKHPAFVEVRLRLKNFVICADFQTGECTSNVGGLVIGLRGKGNSLNYAQLKQAKINRHSARPKSASRKGKTVLYCACKREY